MAGIQEDIQGGSYRVEACKEKLRETKQYIHTVFTKKGSRYDENFCTKGNNMVFQGDLVVTLI